MPWVRDLVFAREREGDKHLEVPGRSRKIEFVHDLVEEVCEGEDRNEDFEIWGRSRK